MKRFQASTVTPVKGFLAPSLQNRSTPAACYSLLQTTSRRGYRPPVGSAGGSMLSRSMEPTVTTLLQRVDRLEKEIQILKLHSAPTDPASAAGVAAGVAGAAGSTMGASGAASMENMPSHEDFMAAKDAKLDNIDNYKFNSESSADLYHYYAMLPETPIDVSSLLTMDTFDDLLRFTRLLWREIRVRLAHDVVELQSAPFGVGHMPSTACQRRWHERFFDEVRTQFPECPQTESELRRFDAELRCIVRRHRATAHLLSFGIFEFAKREGWSEERLRDLAIYRQYADLESFAGRFEQNRVCFRFVLEHYLACARKILKLGPEVQDVGSTARDPLYGHKCNFVGAIATKCNVVTLAQLAIAKATQDAIAENFCDPPEIQLKVTGDPNFTFVHPPALSYRVIWLLVRDAQRRTAAKYCRDGVPQQPIEVVVCQKATNSDVTVRVCSVAGGISAPYLPVAATNMFALKRFYEDSPYFHGITVPPARLPRAVAAAKVIGGDVTLASVDGLWLERQYYIPCQSMNGLLV